MVGETNWIRSAMVFVNRFHEVGTRLADTAYRLGVDKIVEAALPFDGGVFEDSRGSIIIKLNSLSPRTRRRFTLAHEPGHLMISRTFQGQVWMHCVSAS